MTADRALAVQKAEQLQKKYATCDPFAIAKQLGVEVRYMDSFKQLKGMYAVIARNRFIFLNANSSEEMNRIVCAHELGHDQLHRDAAKGEPLQEFALWDLSGVREYEANLFAAHLLLRDEEILSRAAQGKTCAEIAAITETDPNLVALKVECLQEKGYSFCTQVYENRFLK